MSNVAIVTGGTRGIVQRSVMLKESGFTVAATFAGNQERADAFTTRTGIPNYRWDVSDFAARSRRRPGRGGFGPGLGIGHQRRHHP